MYNIGLEISKDHIEGHKFIQSTNQPLSGYVTLVSLFITNQYFKKNYSAAEWRKEKRKWPFNYEFPPGQPQLSKPINYLVISEYVRQNGNFDPNAFNLPDIGCMWLDHATEMKINFYMNGASIQSGDLQKHYYGENYPIHPELKREGRMYTSIQPQLIRRIIRKREELINNSNEALSDDWIFDLRSLISDAISLIDIAFTQLYIKAEYDPLPQWKFDKQILGERHGRRLNEKFKWVFQITGNNLNIEAEKNSLDTLRMLRNHLMHFDPPSLVVTLEEAAVWLNDIIRIGLILAKFRKAINVDISTDIMNFLLQKEAIFVPLDDTKRRPLSTEKKEDYYSSTWPHKE